MPTRSGQWKTITEAAVEGMEPDEFSVAFQGRDGSLATAAEFALPAGKVGTWELRVRVAESVTRGGGFLFQRKGFLLGHRTQDYNPLGRDYVTLEATTGATLQGETMSHWKLPLERLCSSLSTR